MRNHWLAWCGVAASMLFLGAECGCSKSAAKSAGNSAAPLEQQKLRRVKNAAQITDAEAAELAGRIEEAVQTGNVDMLNALFDYETVGKIATEGIAVDEKYRREFTAGMIKGARGGGGLAQKIIDAASQAQGGSYVFLRLHDHDKSRRLLFRMLLADGGLNYHDWIMERRGDGSLGLADVYLFNLGEPISQSMRRMYAAAVANENRGFLDRLTGAQQDYVKHMGDLQKMSQLLPRQPAEALAIYRKLPVSLQKDRLVLGIRLTAAQAVNDTEYAAAIDDFNTYFPNDAATNLMLIDGYLLQKRYQDSLAAIDTLDNAIGGDPYLDVLRCNIHLESGDRDAARAAAEAAVAVDSTLLAGYWLLVSQSLTSKEPAETLRLLKLLETEHHVEFGDLATLPDYSEFVKTDEYQQWLAAHSSSPETAVDDVEHAMEAEAEPAED